MCALTWAGLNLGEQLLSSLFATPATYAHVLSHATSIQILMYASTSRELSSRLKWKKDLQNQKGYK